MLVSAIRHRFSRQQSSITARMRNLREAPKLSARKSSDQRAWGCAACGIGVRVPRARLRPRRRFTDSVVGKTVPRTVFRSSSILPVEPIELLVVHDHALAFEQHADPAIAEPAPLSGDVLHLLADLGARHWARTNGAFNGSLRRAFAPDRPGIDTDKPAGPALRDIVIPHCPERCLSPLGQRRQFFPSRSFRTTLSSIVSASRRLSLAFSSSSAFSLAASETSMPPYLAFSL